RCGKATQVEQLVERGAREQHGKSAGEQRTNGRIDHDADMINHSRVYYRRSTPVHRTSRMSHLQLSANDFAALAARVTRMAADYLAGLEDRRTFPKVSGTAAASRFGAE